MAETTMEARPIPTEEPGKEKKKRKFSFPSAFTILFIVTIIAVICTWFVPAGQYSKLLYDADSGKLEMTTPTGETSQLDATQQTLDDLGVKIEVEETGETFAENSLLKARAVMEATKLPAIADDSGLCVDALNGGPGVYSARFGGEGLDDTGRYRLLLQMMHGQADRRAHFHTTITCAFPNGDVLQDDGEVEGTIAFAPMGENGFGYDPVFFVPDKRKTFAQLSAEEKAEISHRGKALRAFKETLKNYLAEHQ